MFKIYVCGHKLKIRRQEVLTSGSVNVYSVHFEFSKHWMELERTVVFRCGNETASVKLDDSGVCMIPGELLSASGRRLETGVYGTLGGEIVLTTPWASLGMVLTGVSVPEEDGTPSIPEMWEQALAGKGDKLDYTPAGELGLYAGNNLLSSVPISGGDEGVSDHRMLSHRGDEKQHPIEAIDGLQEELKRIPAPVEPMTNEELEDILK